MFFIHSAVFVVLVWTLVTAGAERRGITELTFGCHAHPPRSLLKNSVNVESAVEILRLMGGPE